VKRQRRPVTRSARSVPAGEERSRYTAAQRPVRLPRGCASRSSSERGDSGHLTRRDQQTGVFVVGRARAHERGCASAPVVAAVGAPAPTARKGCVCRRCWRCLCEGSQRQRPGCGGTQGPGRPAVSTASPSTSIPSLPAASADSSGSTADPPDRWWAASRATAGGSCPGAAGFRAWEARYPPSPAA
jgi:hypothetical protein